VSYSQSLPYAAPYIEAEEIEGALSALKSGWFTQGPRVAAFENAFSEYLGGGKALALSSATAALHLSLICAGVKPGDEVITTPFTFASTANVIELLGATTVFADVEDTTLNIDVEAVRSKITAKTKAIIPVHFAGFPCDIDALRLLCQQQGISLVEDATHAVGAEYKGRKVGCDSQFGAFSFYPIKNMTAIEGGMLVVNTPELAERIRILRWYGLSEATWERMEGHPGIYSEVLEPGLKYNMNDVQAAVGLAQLKKLDFLNKKRSVLAERYRRYLQEVDELTLLKSEDNDRRSSHYLFVVRVSKHNGIDRDGLALGLRKCNIGSSFHYRSLHLHPYYKAKYPDQGKGLKIAEKASDEVLSLPLFPRMDESDVDRVVNEIKRLFARH
jgi:dTDP-4-amino-4,6-dideoxygalactose transaminase